MARLSLWKDGRHSNDYKFFDRRISEMFTVGGTGILVHKYLGTNAGGLLLSTNATQASVGTVLNFANTLSVNIGDAVSGTGVVAGTTVVAKDAATITLSQSTVTVVPTGTSIGFTGQAAKPAYANQSALNIQDLLFMENRDRKYDTSIYKMRGIYQVADQDFDLSQFGLFLATGTLFMVFHLNDMIDILGRRIMNGDVLELQHLVDYDPINQDLPAALKRFFVVGDCTRASEGYSPTWWPHLWRCKLNPLVDSQEYKDILNNITAGTNNTPLSQILSVYNTNIAINDAIIKEAEQNLPQSGFDTSPLYVKPLNIDGTIPNNNATTADNNLRDASNITEHADEAFISPTSKIEGYLTGDGLAPNGFPVVQGIAFPDYAKAGEFALRTDYIPNRLFRFDGTRWIRIEDVQRTNLTPNSDQNKTLFSGFTHNSTTWVDSQGNTRHEKQSLADALKPKADN